MNKVLTILLVLSIASAISAQVDTLMLVEDNNIEVPDSITSIYVENITDSTKAIFICTPNHVYVYNSENLTPLWTSPRLIRTADLKFADMNNDGAIDLAAKDSTHIYLFDFMNDQTIWTSPDLDNTYRCYAVGDRNNDGYNDAAIITQIPTPTGSDYDTVYVRIFDGPALMQTADTLFLVQNYYINESHPNVSIACSDTPGLAFISRFGFVPKILIFSYYYYSDDRMFVTHYDGNLRILNGLDLSIDSSQFIGNYILSDKLYSSSSHSAVFVGYARWTSVDSYSLNRYYRSVISANQVVCNSLWSREAYHVDFRWTGFDVAKPAIDSSEIACFSYLDSLSLCTFPQFTPIWNMSIGMNIYKLESFINYSGLATPLNILCQYRNQDFKYMLHNSENGAVAAVIENSDIDITTVADLNSDGNDEILAIDGNTLYIYHLDYFVDIDQPATIPKTTFLQPNYPNPFNASTTIEYGLDSDQQVTIDIYDLLGRKVETLVDEPKPAGLYRAIWDAGELPSGMYFCRIVTDSYSKTRKMMLLK